MIIKNKLELATTELRKQVLDIVEAGIARVLPAEIMKSAVRYDPVGRILVVNDFSYDLSPGRVFVIGGGKASALMAETLEDILSSDNISAGVVNCNYQVGDGKQRKVRVIEAGHPLPDERGLAGVRQMLALKEQYAIGANDLVICLISGGGSALMPCPAEGVSLAEKQKVTRLLLGCGATIHEINAVRKHLSRTKGGQLGGHFSPATVVSLILSDVVGNDLDVIASGQTCPDASSFIDACNVLEKYGLLERVPRGVRDVLSRGCQGEVEETPKTLNNCHNHIIGDNRLAMEAMADKARELGLTPSIVTAEQEGETTAVAQSRAAEVLAGKYAGVDVILIGGETTPKLPANAGRGGRNQHYAAVSMLAMAPYAGEWVVASVGTDGADFLPEVAGAIVDNSSLSSASGIDVKSYLDRYDSHTLLAKMGRSLIVTGSTGTNVGDVIVYALR
ncbi:MAG: D-glycerate 2-kinase [Dehalococcoidales bacterium]|nr:D-glycerate 2-kinase [Dehalococcoidales bacterium]